MKPSPGTKSPSASTGARRSKKAVEPDFPPLTRLPTTAPELFRALAVTVSATVNQTDTEEEKAATKKQNYTLPWASFASWRDARERLTHFEKTFTGGLGWVPFNDSASNDGPMSLNAYPGRAFIERVTNEGDANLEAKALAHTGPMPTSPADAVATWFGLGAGALAAGLDDDSACDLAKRTVTVAAFVGDPKDPKDCILDARDYGVGLTAAEMPNTILSLNRGLKKSKLYLTGKHGQGASSTYQYSDLTLIASRKLGSKTVAFTLVEGTWDVDAEGRVAKTPTYKYLVIDGKVPEIPVSEGEFRNGTLVRHIGYTATDLFASLGENSLYGLLMRSLAEPLFPVWLEKFELRPSKAEGYSTFPGYRRFGRVIRGSVNSLERAYQTTLGVPADDELQTRILHRASEYYTLPTWDYGARTGVAPLGKVKITYWVVEPRGRSSQDVLRNWVDPDKTILLTLDGQTHAEESRAIITGQQGAKLWAVGRYMVVQIDCNGLDPRAKYEMFTSTREHAKETEIKRMILAELVRRLLLDKKLEDLNVKLAAADIKQPADGGEAISSLIRKYLKTAGVSFEQLTRKVEKWVDVEEEREVAARKPEPPPITAVDPPTFVRWRFTGTSIRLHPGQKYSYVFETDAAASCWNPEDPSTSQIKVLAHLVRYTGSGEMRGGRVRCHFECPEDAVVGAKGFIQVQLDLTLGQAKTHKLPVEVVERPKEKKKGGGAKPPKEPAESGEAKQVIKIKVRKKDFTEVEIPVVTPQPVTKTSPDGTWQTLGWPHDHHRVGFSIRTIGGRVRLYYNAEFPPFLDHKRKLSKKSLEEEFIRRYQMKLVIHTIFALNYDFLDEEEFTEEQRKRIRDLLCATAESLALATKSEIEIERRVKSEDQAPVDSPVAANLHDAATTEEAEAVPSSTEEPTSSLEDEGDE